LREGHPVVDIDRKDLHFGKGSHASPNGEQRDLTKSLDIKVA